jgi:hypothetical protein
MKVLSYAEALCQIEGDLFDLWISFAADLYGSTVAVRLHGYERAESDGSQQPTNTN